VCIDLTPAFQSTLPREERHAAMQAVDVEKKFQSTLPREERPPSPIHPQGIFELDFCRLNQPLFA
jgi:hypothetical protein